MEKLIKSLEQLKTYDVGSSDVVNKKKEIRVHLFNLTELMCNTSLQTHKDFVNYIGPGIASLIKLCDASNSDIRLASDEGLSKVIKALLELHSNRVLVELCRQIKRNENSSRVLKLCMNRFGELCHHTRPQKRRAYLANLLNAISAIACRKEEILHESLALFIQKVFTVMGAFTYENETKTLLKLFITNLSSESSVIRRCASSSISTITFNNRKPEVMLVLVTNFLIGQITISEDHQPIASPVVIGTLLTLKMLLGALYSDKIGVHQESVQYCKTIPEGRMIQIFELCLSYSLSTDHNVVNAALETLQQVLKMHDKSIIAALRQPKRTLRSRFLTLSATSQSIGHWNLTPLLPAEESHLLENEVQLPGFETRSLRPFDLDERSNCEFSRPCFAEEVNGTAEDFSKTDSELCKLMDPQDQTDTDSYLKVNFEALQEECSLLILCCRHLVYYYLLTGTKGELKSDRDVRVSVKNLALNCLFQLGTLEPEIWNTTSCRSLAAKDIHVVDVLGYSEHDDPQLRGQAALLASSILKSQAVGYLISGVSSEKLLNIITSTLEDKETAACRLAIQGLELCMIYALESSLCASMTVPLNSLLSLATNTYWLVKVELLDALKTLSWSSLQYGMQNVPFQIANFQKHIIDNVIGSLIGDEDHRVRGAVANCLIRLVQTWTKLETKPYLERIKRLCREPYRSTKGDLKPSVVAAVPVSVNGLTKCFEDIPRNEDAVDILANFVEKLLNWLVTSDSKYTKTGCIQSLAALVSFYPPSCYPDAYGCDPNGYCGLLKLSMSLLSNSTYMLDIPTHQSLLTLATQTLAGCIKLGLTSTKQSNRDETSELEFLSSETKMSVYNLLTHVARVLNAFCCVIEDLNPQASGLKSPLVTLPNPSSLSPIRRKSKATHSGENLNQEKEDKCEETGRKWNKPTQLLNPNNLGYVSPSSLYVKLFDLLKSTYSTCKLNFDPSTTERLSYFLQSNLEALAVILEVSGFDEIGKHSEEILNYLRLTIAMEPASCLRAVQQLLKSLFGVNLSALWCDEASRLKLDDPSAKTNPANENSDLVHSFSNTCRLTGKNVSHSECDFLSVISQANLTSRPHVSLQREKRQIHLTTKFRTVGKMGPDKTVLSSYIRIFEPIVVKALKLYTVSSNVEVQKHVLDLLCELIHLCVNYCLLDADQVFLNFVIQQFEFLEEGFIPDIEILLPSMFRFLSLLSYDRYHSKTIISIPRIMQLSGGLMATGKDVKIHVLPTLPPIVEDLFLSKERMNDNARELETQKEVLINMLLRLIHHHKVYPLLSVVLNQTLAESATKWKCLSKQICDVIVPQFQKRSIDLESTDALNLIHNMFLQLDPSAIHESLFGLMQTFGHSSPDDMTTENYVFHRTLACRIAVIEVVIAVFDESFLMECLSELNLSYLVNQCSDPLNVTPGESLAPECIFANLLLSTLKTSLYQLIKEQVSFLSETATHWNPDESSILAFLIIRLIFATTELSNNEFPRMNNAIEIQLNEGSIRNEIIALADRVVSYNPLVAIRVYELTGASRCASQSDEVLLDSSYSLNRSIGKMGKLFSTWTKLVKGQNSGELADFVNAHVKEILLYWEEATVTDMTNLLPTDNSTVETLIDFCLHQKEAECMIQFSLSLIGMLEMACRLDNMCSFGNLLSAFTRFQSISHEIIHRKLSKVIISLRNQSSHDIFLRIFEIINCSPHYQYYKKFCDARNQREFLLSRNQWKNNITIDKRYFMEIALKRNITPRYFRTIERLDAEDVDALSRNRKWLITILKNYKTIHPDVLIRVKYVFFQMMSEKDFDSCYLQKDEIFWAADMIRHLIDCVSHSNLEIDWNPSDIRVLAKLSILFLTEVKDLTVSSMLLLRTTARVVKLGDHISREWSRIECFSIVKTATGALIELANILSNGRKLPEMGIPGLMENSTLPGYSECVCNVIRLVSLLECSWVTVPEILLEDLKQVVTGLCRMPLFYAYAIVPPSIWGKINWTPCFRLESQLAVELPVVPSDLLHDEITLREFMFRIDKFGWISRPKFEEIWMSILGILNLNEEAQFVPEEQACAIQTSCTAVRALTMLLEKNLPYVRTEIGNVCCNSTSLNSTEKASEFLRTRNGQKLGEIYSLIDYDPNGVISVPHTHLCVYASFRYLQHNLSSSVPYSSTSGKQTLITTNDSTASVDTGSCIHFLIDLYTQWIQNPNTPYALLLEVFRSLTKISDFFTECQQFSWLLEQSLAVQKESVIDDPHCLEPSLVLCILKSLAFLNDIESEIWETAKKIVEMSMGSQNISSRSNVLLGVLYLLQKRDYKRDCNLNTVFANITMDYVAKYLNSEQVGPDWHHSLMWAMAFYVAEHFPDQPFRTTSVAEHVVHSALNAILDSCKIPIEIQIQLLQGLEQLCVMDRLDSSLRRLVKKEIINIIRNIDRHSVFHSAVKCLLALVYKDIANQLHKPGADPETMLTALEWIGVLFQRMKRGTDYEVDLLSRVLPIVTCDVFPPADILNRLLAEFMSPSRPSVAVSLTPTIFQVFNAARTQGQQPLVLEWILMIIANFTRMSTDEASVATWNHLCFFTAASCNPWLRSVFSFVNRPINEEDPFEVEVFVAAAIDFQSQLDTKQRTIFDSNVLAAKEKSRLFSAVHSSSTNNTDNITEKIHNETS